jgi:hypothetical protein
MVLCYIYRTYLTSKFHPNNNCCTGHTQKNGAVSIVFIIETAPFFCVYPVLPQLQTTFHTQGTGVIVIYLQTKFHILDISSYSPPSTAEIKWRYKATIPTIRHHGS